MSDFFRWLWSLLGISQAAPPGISTPAYTAQQIKNLVYRKPPNQMPPDMVFAQFALEVGIEDYNWRPGATFLATKSLSNRHVGSGRGTWTGVEKLVLHKDGRAPERLRVYSSPEQSLDDYAQLMKDPLYAAALNASRRGDRIGFFKGLSDAGYDTPSYAMKLENRYQALRARGVI